LFVSPLLVLAWLCRLNWCVFVGAREVAYQQVVQVTAESTRTTISCLQNTYSVKAIA
jgi:hypothetical protein